MKSDFYLGSCRRLHAAPRGHGAPVDRTLDVENLNETPICRCKGKNDLTLSCHFITHASSHFLPSIGQFFLGKTLCKNMYFLTPVLFKEKKTFYGCILSCLGRRVSVSCALTQDTLCDYYFSCLTQFACGVHVLCGSAQQLNDMTACMLEWWEYRILLSCIMKLCDPGVARTAIRLSYDCGNMHSWDDNMVKWYILQNKTFIFLHEKHIFADFYLQITQKLWVHFGLNYQILSD